MSDIRWYTTLALWKSVVFMEGNYKRAIAGTTDDPYLKQFGEGVLELARQAEEVALDGGLSARRIDPRRGTGGRQRGDALGLLIDWGGVLTTNLFASFHAYCVRGRDRPADAARDASARDPEARELLIALEKGELEERALRAAVRGAARGRARGPDRRAVRGRARR